MSFRIQNVFHNFSFVHLNHAHQLMGNNVGPADIVQVQWVNAQTGTAHLFVAARGRFLSINGANEVVGSVNPQLLQLEVQGNGSFIIHAVGNNIQRLVLNHMAGPVTNEPAPLVGAPDFKKQFWMLVK